MLLQKKSVILALTLLSWLSDGSQFIRRSVEGWVTDQRGNPIAGAAVQMENTMDLRVRSFITQTDGHYNFDGLADDIDYTLKARYFNYSSQPKTLSKFESSIHARVNLVITIDGSTRPMSSVAPSMRMGEVAADVALNGANKDCTDVRGVAREGHNSMETEPFDHFRTRLALRGAACIVSNRKVSPNVT